MRRPGDSVGHGGRSHSLMAPPGHIRTCQFWYGVQGVVIEKMQLLVPQGNTVFDTPFQLRVAMLSVKAFNDGVRLVSVL